MKPSLQAAFQIHRKRITPSKKLLLELLDDHSSFTTRDLYTQVADKMNEATFYRILKQFRELNIVQDVVIQGTRKIELSDEFTDHHHHLVCGKCGKVVNINDMKLEQYLKHLAISRKFLPLSHSFEVVGLCETCKPKSNLFEAATE